MIEIDLNKPSTARRTALIYGATRSGKTHFGATAPRPLFLSEKSESGWTTIMNMDRNLWWEPEVEPIVWAIESVADMAQAFVKAQPLIASGRVRSVVVDSLTFYGDLYLQWAYTMTNDTRKIYGDLGIHLRDLRVKWHSLPINALWLCLIKEPDEVNKIAGPMIPGQQAGKFTAGCDSILFCRNQQLHTKKQGVYLAGGREGANDVIDPVPNSTFRGYLQAIGDPEQSLTGEIVMPSVPAAPAKAKSATAAVPPVRPAVRGPVVRR